MANINELDYFNLELYERKLADSSIDKCIEIVKRHIHPNCDNHFQYGECSNCRRSDNPDLIKYPEELLEELESLKTK